MTTAVVENTPAIADRGDLMVGSMLGMIRLRDMWIQSGAQALPKQLADAIEDVIMTWEEGDIPAICRPLYDPYMDFAKKWTKFLEYQSEKDRAPRKEFWDAVSHLESLLINREERFLPPILETVTELRGQSQNHGNKGVAEVSWIQICYIYAHKGRGPFMNPNKLPEPRLAQQQYKFENLCEDCRRHPGEPHRYCGKCRGARNVIKEWFDAQGLNPYDNDGNMVSLAAMERMRAGGRVTRALQDRVARLLGGGLSVEAGEGLGGLHNVDESLSDEVPLTRAQMDAAEASGTLPEAGTMPGEKWPSPDEPTAAPDTMEGMVQRSEEAALAQQAYALIDANPNIDNRSIADTLGVSVNQVKKWRQNRKLGQ